jgi:hypothetical protein
MLAPMHQIWGIHGCRLLLLLSSTCKEELGSCFISKSFLILSKSVNKALGVFCFLTSFKKISSYSTRALATSLAFISFCITSHASICFWSSMSLLHRVQGRLSLRYLWLKLALQSTYLALMQYKRLT